MPTFQCTNCGARYELVRMEAPPAATDREITCISCGGPLPGREGTFIFKYFCVDRAGKRKTLSPVRLDHAKKERPQ
jgi:hypothetical protein